MGLTLESTTNGDGVRALVGRAKPSGVKVGVLAGTGAHPNSKGTSIAEIAFYNEFGTRVGGEVRIEARPFLRTALRENKRAYALLMRKLLKALLLGRVSVKRAQDMIGVKAVDDIQLKIVDIKTPENKAATLAKKKPKTNPLIEDGFLRGAINYQGIKV